MENIHAEIVQLENELHEKKQRLAELRQNVPEVKVENYPFLTAQGERVTLQELFHDKKELIVIHNMGKSCSYCTMWADGFNGVYHHIKTKAAFVVATPDTPPVQADFAAVRRWTFPIISTTGSRFTEDMGFAEHGRNRPGVSTFRLDQNGDVYRIAQARFGPGDNFCSVWHLFDLLPSGSTDFRPASKITSESPFELTNNIAIQVHDYENALDFYENTMGMKVEKIFDNETKLSISGVNLYLENNESGRVYFELTVENIEKSREMLLNAGCNITKEYSSKSLMISDPYGLKFHLYESNS
ncbi:DUF899 family protein [Thalassobacillus sp. CUG 92003]|uniref:DUF899 family protein n=1 Tax=Thalassobacillus sp. CUG 92003 TaxID=2736641 RepID=UPI001C624C1D|nr:DUF899 family protein [Thalassobacillus sp. CUG 92003]